MHGLLVDFGEGPLRGSTVKVLELTYYLVDTTFEFLVNRARSLVDSLGQRYF